MWITNFLSISFLLFVYTNDAFAFCNKKFNSVMYSLNGISFEQNSSTTEESETLYNEKNLYNDNYKILVSLSVLESNKFLDYSENDFYGISCLSLKELSSEYTISLMNSQNMDTSFNRIFSFYIKKNKIKDCLEILQDKEKFLNYDIFESNDLVLNSDLAYNEFVNDIYYQNYLEAIQLPEAHKITTGNPSVQIGIIDSGINKNHISLSEANISNIYSRDFTNETDDPFLDKIGHGTAVASVISGRVSGSTEVFGIAPDVTLISLKVCNSQSSIDVEKIIEAIYYAQSINIPVLNLSITGGSSSTYETAINNYDGVIFVSAGNHQENFDLVDCDIAPICFPSENLVVVGGLMESTLSLYYQSNIGTKDVDIMAPGEKLLTATDNDELYDYLSAGTSYSAPIAAGIAGLIIAATEYNYISREDLLEAFYNGADKYDLLANYCKTGSRVNAYKPLLDLPVHTHKLSDEYYSTSLTQHYKICVCGYSEYSGHVSNGIVYSSGRGQYKKFYSTCIYCNSMMLMGV